MKIAGQPDDEYGHTLGIDWGRIRRELDMRRKRRPWTKAQKAAAARKIARNGGSRNG